MTCQNLNEQKLVAANCNPGGATIADAPLRSIVELMARAYVAELKKKEQSS